MCSHVVCGRATGRMIHIISMHYALLFPYTNSINIIYIFGSYFFWCLVQTSITQWNYLTFCIVFPYRWTRGRSTMTDFLRMKGMNRIFVSNLCSHIRSIGSMEIQRNKTNKHLYHGRVDSTFIWHFDSDIKHWNRSSRIKFKISAVKIYFKNFATISPAEQLQFSNATRTETLMIKI